MNFRINSIVILFIHYILDISLALLNRDDFEWCIDSNYHKKVPGKESKLFSHCEPWKERSCCTEEISQRIHSDENHYKFDYDHCKSETNIGMSKECRRHFIQDLCFYECEPSVKPWIVKVNRSFARERIYNVPLCASDCEIWWSKCKFDYTCAYNWPRDFDWVNRRNICKRNAKCRPFYEIYKNAQDFCEKVWDHSWRYTPDNDPCMRIWFNSSYGNPNAATADFYAQRMAYFKNGQSKDQSNIQILWMLSAIALLLN